MARKPKNETLPRRCNLTELEAAPSQPKSQAPKRGRGRLPDAVTPEKIDEICKYMKQGNYLETACAMVGLPITTMRECLKRGIASYKGLSLHDPVAELCWTKIREAQAFSEAWDVGVITRAAQAGQWQAAAWRLERKSPKRWGKKVQVDADVKHSGPGGAPIEIANITPEERERRIAELEAKRKKLNDLTRTDRATEKTETVQTQRKKTPT